MTAAPSICERIRSGLAAKPQSIAVWTSGTRTVPSSSTFTCTTRRHVGHEAAVHGDAEPFARGQLLAPAGLLRGELDHVPQPRGVDREHVVGLAVVP